MCRFISIGLANRGYPGWNPVQYRARCSGYILNLALQAFLYLKDQDAIDEALRQVAADEEPVPIDNNLARQMKDAQAAGWRKIRTHGKLHNLIVHIRASEQRYNNFKRRAGQA